MKARAVLAIAWKDILDAIKNRYLLMSLLMPVVMTLFFQLVFGTGTSDLGKITVAVYDPGGSRLTAQLQGVTYVKVVMVESAQALIAELDKTAVGGIDIPMDFDKNVDLGKQPELTVYINSGKGGSGATAFRQLITQQVWTMREQSVPAKIVWSETTPANGEKAPATSLSKYYLLVVFLAMSLTMTGGFVVPLLMVEEKEKHTMEFLLVSPVTPAEIAVGKAITGLVYCCLGAALLIAINHGWSGNWPLTFLTVFLGAFFLVSVGLLMGSVLNTALQVNGWSTLVLMVLLAPSWVSFLSLPPFMDTIMRIIPTYYWVKVLSQSLSNEATLSGAALELAPLVGCLVVTFGLVVWTIRRQEV